MKRLGQHFLTNKKAVETIIDALGVSKNETIFEIGPGTGALMLPLAKECEIKGARLVAIEKDERLISSLSKNKLLKNAEIIHDDALSFFKKFALKDSNYKIIGNIPYYITGHLLRVLSELEKKPTITVLMIQREVALRLASHPPKMNLLAATVQIWARPEIIMSLSPDSFDPPPKVESVVISLTPHSLLLPADLTSYFRFARIMFKQPRKTVLNNLREADTALEKVRDILKKEGLTGNERPGNLSLEVLIRLSRNFG